MLATLANVTSIKLGGRGLYHFGVRIRIGAQSVSASIPSIVLSRVQSSNFLYSCFSAACFGKVKYVI